MPVNEAHRRGSGTYRDGDYSYEGEWIEDEMHGLGRFTFASGAEYDGSWEHNKYCGDGKYKWPGGAVYEVRYQTTL